MSQKVGIKTPRNFGIITWMAIVHVLAVAALVLFPSWENFLVFLIMYFVTACLGITLTYHRLLTHRSYSVPKWLERILTTCGVLALQGGPSEWIAHHRMHHAGSDTVADPHNARQGFWFSHFLWMTFHNPEFDDLKRIRKFSRDIYSDPYYRWLDHIPVQIALQVALGVLLYALGGWGFVFWGGFLRIVWVYHVTWAVNSATHKWGYQNYDSGDLARNNWLIGLLAFGEGWHNNHHAHQKLAPNGHKWWEIDMTYWIIVLLGWLGLAKNIKTLAEIQGKPANSSGVLSEPLLAMTNRSIADR